MHKQKASTGSSIHEFLYTCEMSFQIEGFFSLIYVFALWTTTCGLPICKITLNVYTYLSAIKVNEWGRLQPNVLLYLDVHTLSVYISYLRDEKLSMDISSWWEWNVCIRVLYKFYYNIVQILGLKLKAVKYTFVFTYRHHRANYEHWFKNKMSIVKLDRKLYKLGIINLNHKSMGLKLLRLFR